MGSRWLLCGRPYAGRRKYDAKQLDLHLDQLRQYLADEQPPVETSRTSIAMSADGTKMVTVGFLVCTSTNSGMTWATNNLPAIHASAATISADGAKMVVTDKSPSGAIYTSYPQPASTQPILNLKRTGNFQLSWLMPSTNFTLQQSSDLTNWTAVTNVPVLNLTNLQNQVSLPLPAGNVFFRLSSTINLFPLSILVFELYVCGQIRNKSRLFWLFTCHRLPAIACFSSVSCAPGSCQCQFYN